MKVVHCKRESYTHYIGRPSLFGNPYSLDDYSREEAIEKYEAYARNNPRLLQAIKELSQDEILGCWCMPLRCHGEVIINLWQELNIGPDDPEPAS